jgi:hypothetical protein
MGNLVSVTVKSIGDQQVANNTYLLNKKFVVNAVEANSDTEILYNFKQSVSKIVVDETGLSLNYEGAGNDAITVSVIAVDNISQPTLSVNVVVDDIIICAKNTADANDTDIFLADGRQLTVSETIAEVVAENPTVKVYRALITQSGEDNPVATVLENTTGATLSYSFDEQNFGYIDANRDIFSQGKVIINGKLCITTSDAYCVLYDAYLDDLAGITGFIYFDRLTDSQIRLTILADGNRLQFSNSLLCTSDNPYYIEILIYP